MKQMELSLGVELCVLIGGLEGTIAVPTYADNSCQYNLGQSVTGQVVSLNRCSIQRQANRRVDFAYNLDREVIKAQANCLNNTWITLPEQMTHRPQSQATSNLMKIVCSAPSASEGNWIGIVFDPPSHIRKRPNGEIVCTIRDVQAIELAGSVTEDGWVRTTACGGGVIHPSQVH